MKRYEALKVILSVIPKNDVVLFATGMTCREGASIKDRDGHFYIIGSMGFISSLGLGLAIATHRRVWVIDGDGSALMDMGTMANIAEAKPENFVHIILDNGQYQSTGGQPTISSVIDLARLAAAAGYESADVVSKYLSVETVQVLASQPGPSCLVVKVEGGSQDVPRIPVKPKDMSQRLKAFIDEDIFDGGEI